MWNTKHFLLHKQHQRNNTTNINNIDYTINDGSYTKSELMTELENTAGVTTATYSSTTGKIR